MLRLKSDNDETGSDSERVGQRAATIDAPAFGADGASDKMSRTFCRRRGDNTACEQIEYGEHRSGQRDCNDKLDDVAGRHDDCGCTKQLYVSAAHPASAPAESGNDEHNQASNQASNQMAVERLQRKPEQSKGCGHPVGNCTRSNIVESGGHHDADAGEQKAGLEKR